MNRLLGISVYICHSLIVIHLGNCQNSSPLRFKTLCVFSHPQVKSIFDKSINSQIKTKQTKTICNSHIPQTCFWFNFNLQKIATPQTYNLQQKLDSFQTCFNFCQVHQGVSQALTQISHRSQRGSKQPGMPCHIHQASN